jgi:hypothetical protein
VVCPARIRHCEQTDFLWRGGSEKLLEDIRAILNGEHRVDQDLLQQWVEKPGLQKEWNEVSSSDT